MENKVNEELVFEQIQKLKMGNNEEKSLAFDLMGILGDELSKQTYEEKLKRVEKLIKDYYLNK